MSAETILFLDHTFTISRKSRRSMLTIKLKVDEFQIAANKTVPQGQILDFLLSKKSWLEKNIKVIEQQRKLIPRPEFFQGHLFPFLGEFKYFNFGTTKLKKVRFAIEEGFLVGFIPESKPEIKSDKKILQKTLVQFYKNHAAEYLPKRASLMATEMNLRPTQIKIQTAKTRWGSCSSAKVIHLNWKLMFLPKTLIDYVIVHELCHLQHLNHSQKFWDMVEYFSPNYREAEAEIKSQSVWMDFIG